MKPKQIHYISLVLMLIFAIGLIFMARGSIAIQRSIIIVMSIAYVLWGIFHHVLEGDLHFKIVLEYILISATAILLLFSLLK